MSQELVRAAMRHAPDSGLPYAHAETAIAGLSVMWSTTTTMPNGMVYRPSLCMTLQGAKRVAFGDTVFDYGEMSYLLVSMETPAFGEIVLASRERPYVGITLDIDAGMLRSVMETLEHRPAPAPERSTDVFAGTLNPRLHDCVRRLLDLLDEPEAIDVLAPDIKREICYRLLTGPQGRDICKLALPNSHMRRVADAIQVLRQNYTQAVRVEHLADAARMSPSSFHQHFKALTSMTPLQYQKQLRLLEARRLMQSEKASAAHAAFSVGYESPNQFSREYARMFGAPQRRDRTLLASMPA